MQIFGLKINTKDVLVCPARFERATYALEAVKMRLNNTKNNSIKVLAFGVAYTPRIMGSSGMPCNLGGIDRRSNSQTSNLLSKPTNQLSCNW